MQAEAPSRLGAFRHFHTRLGAIDGGHLELAAERSLHHGDGHAAMQISAVALEERMRRNREEDVEITGRPAAHAGLALARKADARAVLNAGRNVDRERTLARDAARARASRAW